MSSPELLELGFVTEPSPSVLVNHVALLAACAALFAGRERVGGAWKEPSEPSHTSILQKLRDLRDDGLPGFVLLLAEGVKVFGGLGRDALALEVLLQNSEFAREVIDGAVPDGVEPLADLRGVDGRLCGFGDSDGLVEVGESIGVNVAMLEVCARNADVNIAVVWSDVGDFVFGVGAGAADALARAWNTLRLRLGSLLAGFRHAMSVTDGWNAWDQGISISSEVSMPRPPASLHLGQRFIWL
jgi:hypothetical protein